MKEILRVGDFVQLSLVWVEIREATATEYFGVESLARPHQRVSRKGWWFAAEDVTARVRPRRPAAKR